MKRLLQITLLLAASLSAAAQTVRQRPTHYVPDGRDFVCTNGSHRYTRALYGGPTVFRIETSDRPVFATYAQHGSHRNLAFRLTVGGTTVALDSTAFCEARYRAGRRTYLLRDPRWGHGELHLSVVADADREGGVWQWRAEGFAQPPRLEAVLAATRVQRFRRAGDLGHFDRPDAFEADPTDTSRQTVGLPLANGTPTYLGLDTTTLSTHQPLLATRYAAAERHCQVLASMVVIDTPDPWLNTIGGTLVAAADGAWDGQTWLHGAVGWRSQLPGWRGAYMGDFLGWPTRQRSHFEAYARSQVTQVPATLPHLQDTANNLARGAYRWGTPMYSNGYICRTPGRNDQFHHYDMNLVYIDELLWHFQFDADTALMRRLWPVIERHLAWERHTWDPDGDHLYDAYCCIWASDALQYHSGAVTHSSAYNYRANRLAARIAELIGRDPTPYRAEAEAIRHAIDSCLWTGQGHQGHWAEYRDFMGRRLLHPDAALWTTYTAIDSEVGTAEQAWRATDYTDRHAPHIAFDYEGQRFATLSTTDWAPYEWSINNVAMAEVMHAALAYYQAGRPEAATRLLRANIVDFMYAGASPANLGQLSALDRNTGEGYRDFADATGIASRAVVEGLFGITPQALDGRCVIRPGFPAAWDSAAIHTPYLDYRFERRGGRDTYTIRQRFAQPLKMVVRQNLGHGRWRDIEGTTDSVQVIAFATEHVAEPQPAPADTLPESQGTRWATVPGSRYTVADLTARFNASVTDIFRNDYRSPRSPYTTLSLPRQGIGDWCSTQRTADIDDRALRQCGGTLTAGGVPFATPATGPNTIYASLWDNYPDSLTLPLRGRARHAYLLMAGSTNHMQYGIVNATVRIDYADGTSTTLALRNPDNWCPIEQDFDDDGLAFRLPQPRPLRLSLQTGTVSRTLAHDLRAAQATGDPKRSTASSDLPADKKPALAIPGGAAQLLDMPLDPRKRLRSLTLTAVANDVVVGLLGVTMGR